jgi:uncharacterized protein YpmS
MSSKNRTTKPLPSRENFHLMLALLISLLLRVLPFLTHLSLEDHLLMKNFSHMRKEIMTKHVFLSQFLTNKIAQLSEREMRYVHLQGLVVPHPKWSLLILELL